MKTIKITEEQLKYYTEAKDVLSEYGAVWGNDNNNVSLRVDSDPNVNNNTNKKMGVDTRVFGTKDDILNGLDGKTRGAKSLTDHYNSKKAALYTLNNLIKWVKNGRKGKPKFENGLDSVTKSTLLKHIESLDDNELLNFLERYVERYTLDAELYINKYNRVNNSDNDNVMRYNMFNIPGTNVKCITLFSMSDFNFSDAIKHGKLRANNKTDDITGNKTDSRLSNKIDVTYDNGIKPNIAQNFSLDGVEDGHFKQQYPNGGYTSVNQFIDKSIVYGASVLNSINFHPDFIVSAPSSSDFNKYFCINLSRKIGSEYIENFFKRNVVNVKFADGTDPETLKSKGFSDNEIMILTNFVKSTAFNEINYLVCKPMQDFVKRYEQYFLTVPSTPGSEPKRGRMNDKLSIDQIINVLCKISFGTALNELGKDEYISYITKVINYTTDKGKLKQINVDELYKNIIKFSGIGKIKRIYNDYLEAHYQFTDNLEMYADKLTQGYRPTYRETQFKITRMDKRYRQYLQNMYVIADKNMTGDALQKRYQNAKFLIYDEDVNSGTTLRLVIDALNEKLPDGEHQIMCMANAYSNSGR